MQQLLLKCVRGEDYQREVKLVSEFYRGDIHEANLQCQLRQFAIIFECDGKKEEAVLSDVLLYMSFKIFVPVVIFGCRVEFSR
jgi:hypothetical protein